ncbi:MAG: hypothetical protein U9Q39_00970 [Pseudomonadota bacterium]|nr:hypothetical protein [Pseudomonadota bacterium]
MPNWHNISEYTPISGNSGWRKPKASPLWCLIDQHFTEFEEVYDDRFADKYGYLRRVILEVVDNFHFCGDLKQGFARIRCPECHH